MHEIALALLALDHIYHEKSLAEYEEASRLVEKRVQKMFPGFTVAYAVEIGAVSVGDRAYQHGGVAHVLLPIPDKRKEEEARFTPVQV